MRGRRAVGPRATPILAPSAPIPFIGTGDESGPLASAPRFGVGKLTPRGRPLPGVMPPPGVITPPGDMPIALITAGWTAILPPEPGMVAIAPGATLATSSAIGP